jgi:putative oxidoreductase
MFMVDTGLLILRIVLGLLFIGHGSQKLFGWFGGYGFQGTGGWLGSMGLRPATFWAFMAGAMELGGGILLLLGLLNPIGSLGVIASMLVAIGTVHWPKIWITENGSEYAMVNIAAVTALAFAGPGFYSLDAYLGIGLPMPETFLIGLAIVVLGAAFALATREQVAAEQPRAAPVAEDELEQRRAA